MTKEERTVVAAFIRQNGHLSYQRIANFHNVHHATIRNIAAEFEISRPVGPKPKPKSKPATAANTEVL
jgi:hypothetical protein